MLGQLSILVGGDVFLSRVRVPIVVHEGQVQVLHAGHLLQTQRPELRSELARLIELQWS